MARFHGEIGYGYTVETSPGVWEDYFVEKKYFGDVIRTARQEKDGESINDDITVNNSISVVADAFASENMFAIRYVRWMGTLWKVPNVEAKSPRLLLRLGGVYNGGTP